MDVDRAFRDELISETVERASLKPLYSELYSEIDLARIKKVSDLSSLPFVTKDDIRKYESEWAVGESLITNIQNTSGSTGKPFFIYRNQEEISFIWDFFKKMLEPEKFKGLLPLQLNVSIPQHGNPTPIPGFTHVLSASTTDNALVEHSFELLRKEFKLPGHESKVSILSGAHLPILLLTHLALERDLDISEFHVKTICLTGRYLTKRWRSIMESTWSAVLIDRYSLSEVFGGATYCHSCKGYHFDTHVVPEVVDVRTGQQINNEGVGMLLLTTLYPFVQAQPFIRYWTGDLFSRKRTNCKSESYYCYGRATHALFSEGSESQVVIPGSAIVEALDSLPYVNRTHHFSDVTSSYPQAVGLPFVKGKVDRTNGKAEVVLFVETLFGDKLFSSATELYKQEIVDKVRREIFEGNPEMGCNDVKISVEFVKAGSLSGLQKKTELWSG